ncbi:hypothetical protein [uncultured Sphingomonas sp.]|uniref:hypothetical protein n=1 Tax=uncultured Sphingomonas sp. TaxID=158754 RepID=UPI0025F5CCBE|nr:hypothetical protein [uncultured Sphingomonas sp.]
MEDFVSTLRFTSWVGKEPPRPERHEKVTIEIVDDPETIVDSPASRVHPISAFVCLIDYKEETRFISCRSFDVIGEYGYVGAICHTANGYRQFRTDRITAVSDAHTGEVLGDGSYFDRFEPRSVRRSAPTWGLPPARKALLVAGLNVLAFMARCDGRWHPLEIAPLERFIYSLWLRKEWDGDPPVGEIMAHAQRLAPDTETFFKALNYYARSKSSTAILKNAVADVIVADGEICGDEHEWVSELNSYLNDHVGSQVADEAIELWIERELE